MRTKYLGSLLGSALAFAYIGHAQSQEILEREPAAGKLQVGERVYVRRTEKWPCLIDGFVVTVTLARAADPNAKDPKDHEERREYGCIDEKLIRARTR